MGPQDPYTAERRGDLRRLDLDAVRTEVRTALPCFPEVAGALLFGSALDFVRAGSDIDVALILAAGSPPDAEFDLAGRVEERLGRLGPHAFHATVLRPEDNSFAFTVLYAGELLYVADEGRVTDVMEAVGREHDDLEPFRRTFYAALGMPL